MLSTEAKLAEKTFSAKILSQPKARELADIAEEFSLGEPFSAAGLHREFADSFFILETKRGKFIVSIEGIKSENEVKHDIELLLFLRRHGFQCLQPLKSRGGQHYLNTDGRFISASRNIDGIEVPVGNLTLGQLGATGHVLADLHLIGRGYKKGVENRFSFPRVAALYQEVRKNLPAHLKTIVRVLDDEVNYLEGYLDNNLPKGIIHGNLSWGKHEVQGLAPRRYHELRQSLSREVHLRPRHHRQCGLLLRRTLPPRPVRGVDPGLRGSPALVVARVGLLPQRASILGPADGPSPACTISICARTGNGSESKGPSSTSLNGCLILRREKDGGMEDLLLSMATGYDYRKYQKSKPSR